MIIHLGNSRLQVYRQFEKGRFHKVLDEYDEFNLFTGPDETIGFQLSGKYHAGDQKDVLNFLNFIQLCNTSSIEIGIDSVLHQLIYGLCRDVLGKEAISSKHIDLYYILPLNSNENLWSGLPTKPFTLRDTRFESIQFIDELTLMLFIAAQRLIETNMKPPLDVFIVFHMDRIPVACRVEYRENNGRKNIKPAQCFELYKADEKCLENIVRWTILKIPGTSFEEQKILPLIKKLEMNESNERLPELETAQWKDILTHFFCMEEQVIDGHIEICCPSYIGICGDSSSYTLIQDLASFPTHSSSVLEFEPSQDNHELKIFWGRFPNQYFCYIFNPVRLSRSKSQSRYKIDLLVEDLSSAQLSIMPSYMEADQTLNRQTICLQIPY